MSYTDLASTGRPSIDRATLNGVKTRRKSLEFVSHGDDAASTSRLTNGNVFTESFATGEICHAKWILCDRVAFDVDATLSLHFLMESAGGGSDQASFDVGYFAIDTTLNDGSELSTQSPTVVAGADVDVSAFSAGGHFVDTYTIPAAVLASQAILCFEIARVAPTGTDHSSNIGLMGAEIQYEINR